MTSSNVTARPVVPPIDVPARLCQLLGMDASHRLLQYGGRWTTLGEVAAAVAQLDEVLSAVGAGPGAKVGLLVRNRSRHVSAILAVLSTRRCLVPVTSIQSDQATVADLERSGIAVLVADEEDWHREGLLAGCRKSGILGIRLSDAPVAYMEDMELRREIQSARGTGVLMPTSGTTGLPKRIPYTYDQLGGALGRVAAYSPATARSLGGPLQFRSGVAVSALTMAHVAGFWTVLQALNEGRALALLDRFEPRAWADLVEEHRTAMAMIPRPR
jgi:acyl-CoA synthetase (AMP-forming)/AMP-acid ligase II